MRIESRVCRGGRKEGERKVWKKWDDRDYLFRISGHCEGVDKKGMIGWIAVIVALILCVVEKWLRSKHIGATLVSMVIYFFIQISINDSPLKCIQEMFSDDTVKFIPIIQTVICVLFSFLYALLLFSDRNTNTV